MATLGYAASLPKPRQEQSYVNIQQLYESFCTPSLSTFSSSAENRV